MSSCKSRFKTFAPGKVMLVGEWAVLEPGNPCVVVPFDKGVTAEVFRVPRGLSLEAPDIGLSVRGAVAPEGVFVPSCGLSSDEEKKFRFAKAAIEVFFRYAKEQGKQLDSVSISVSSDISSSSGFGSSSATVVAIVRALFHFSALKLNNEIVFKLSCIAHYIAQSRSGSCYDVAASTFCEPIIYKRFDDDWLEKLMGEGKDLTEIVSLAWPGLEVRPIKLPKNFFLCVGFVGYSADTGEMIRKMGRIDSESSEVYENMCNSIAQQATAFIDGIERGDRNLIRSAVMKSREILRDGIGDITFETSELKVLCDIAEHCGGCAKISGAGGGDCGIAICFDEKTAKCIVDEWKKQGFSTLLTNGFNLHDKCLQPCIQEASTLQANACF